MSYAIGYMAGVYQPFVVGVRNSRATIYGVASIHFHATRMCRSGNGPICKIGFRWFDPSHSLSRGTAATDDDEGCVMDILSQDEVLARYGDEIFSPSGLSEGLTEILSHRLPNRGLLFVRAIIPPNMADMSISRPLREFVDHGKLVHFHHYEMGDGMVARFDLPK